MKTCGCCRGWSRHPLLLLLFVVAWSVVPVVVHAFPGGAGGCAPDRAAVEGGHLTAAARITGPLANGRLEMVLDDTFVLQGGGATRTNFTIGVDHTLTLQVVSNTNTNNNNENGGPFRGFLFRLGPGDNTAVDTTEALQATTSNTALAEEQCVQAQGVGGVTHTNADLKQTVTGRLRMDQVAVNMPLDVTVVIQNRNGLSEFYYQQFILNAVTTKTGPGGPVPPDNGGDSPTATATQPTLAPVMRPTSPPPSSPTITAPTDLPQKKIAPPAKCGSVASSTGRGGAAAQAKDCGSRVSYGGDGGGGRQRQRRKLVKGQ